MSLITVLLHIDMYLDILFQQFGIGIYFILFTIIFLETGVVATPFLPGDSLIFATGALAARGSLSAIALFIVFSAAAILGDTMNYWIGHALGPKVFRKKSGRFFRKEHLDKTRAFFAKHGPKTIVLGRFIPVIRTFAPFVAGIGAMPYPRFLLYNVIGGIFWVGLFLFAGVMFGNIPSVQSHFSLVLVLIILLSLLPFVWELTANRWRNRHS
jgi:membrane-associated protein